MSQDLIDGMIQSLKALQVQRQSLEAEAEAIVSELTFKPFPDVEPMGIDTPLVDAEGYPRADIDIFRARTLRGRLAEIRTDHKALTKDIERHLHQVASMQRPDKAEGERKEFAARSAVKPKPKYDPVTGKWVVRNWDGTVAGVPNGESRSFDDLPATDKVEEMKVEETATSAAEVAPQVVVEAPIGTSMPSRPFAIVDSVTIDSPADQAGLQVEDLILSFGSVTMDSPNPLQAVGQLVPLLAGDQESVSLTVRRGSQPLTLQLTPRPWSGRGLLGCHILPYSE